KQEIQPRPVAVLCPNSNLWRQFCPLRANGLKFILLKASTCHAVYRHLLGELRALRELNRGFGFGDFFAGGWRRHRQRSILVGARRRVSPRSGVPGYPEAHVALGDRSSTSTAAGWRRKAENRKGRFPGPLASRALTRLARLALSFPGLARPGGPRSRY